MNLSLLIETVLIGFSSLLFSRAVRCIRGTGALQMGKDNFLLYIYTRGEKMTKTVLRSD